MRHGGNDDAYHLPEQEFQSGKKWQMVPVMLLSRQTGEFPPIQMRLCGEIFAQQPGARAGLFASGRQGQRGAAHMAVTIHFRVGDRVRLSKLGKSRTLRRERQLQESWAFRAGSWGGWRRGPRRHQLGLSSFLGL
jgi:hypothetical protein